MSERASARGVRGTPRDTTTGPASPPSVPHGAPDREAGPPSGPDAEPSEDGQDGRHIGPDLDDEYEPL